MKGLGFCLRFLFVLSWQTDRRRLFQGGGLLLAGCVATPVVAWSLKMIVDAVVAGTAGRAGMWAVIAAVTLVGELMLGHFAHLSYYELGEINDSVLNRRLLRTVNGAHNLAACEDPEFADNVDLLRQDIAKMRETLHAALQFTGLAIQGVLTALLLAGVQPWLLLLPLAAAVPIVLGKPAERLLQTAREHTAPALRSINHLRTLASTPASQKEIRLSASHHFLLDRHDQLQRELADVLGRAQRRHAAIRATGQLIFALAYIGSVLLAYQLARRGQASIGDVVLVLTLATQVSTQVATGLELLSTLHAAAAGLGRFTTLETTTTATTTAGPTEGRTGTGMLPFTTERLQHGITFDDVSFTYPGATQPALTEVNLHLPAGSAVAIVGENGAGKSTLIKLLTGLYAPTHGRILIDEVDLATIDIAAWRARTATLFQDFAQLGFTLKESVGIGELTHADSEHHVTEAITRARATTLLDQLPHGLHTLLGGGYGDGHDLSGGQWQNVGLARTLMRQRPLLLCLDEPGHALDPLAEQHLCDTYHTTAHHLATQLGGITIYVTHRLSTVRLADLIIVLDHGHITETGTHTQLIKNNGHYAHLYTNQSRAYT